MTESTAKTDRASEKHAWREAINCDTRCSVLVLRVASALAAMSDDNLHAWPSYEALAFITGGARQNVIKAIDRLWELDYIRIVKDVRPGRKKVNHYHLIPVSDPQPVWTKYWKWKAEQESRQHDPSGDREESCPHPKRVMQASRRDTPA